MLSLCLLTLSGQALEAAVTSGSKQYFLGTDSAPHERSTKETSCGCAGIYSAPIALLLYAQVFEQVSSIVLSESLEASALGTIYCI
jgi:dihydroorotase